MRYSCPQFLREIQRRLEDEASLETADSSSLCYKAYLNPLKESRLSRYLDPSSEKDDFSRFVKLPLMG